ncbi:hypothetical protein WN48_00486 [Eufriesea mexicana]|nr:hypothetical protein WN48_00486 [Eufriesea mexicana]
MLKLGNLLSDVPDPPDRPLISNFTSRSVRLSWVASRNSHNNPILYYVIETHCACLELFGYFYCPGTFAGMENLGNGESGTEREEERRKKRERRLIGLEEKKEKKMEGR